VKEGIAVGTAVAIGVSEVGEDAMGVGEGVMGVGEGLVGTDAVAVGVGLDRGTNAVAVGVGLDRGTDAVAVGVGLDRGTNAVTVGVGLDRGTDAVTVGVGLDRGTDAVTVGVGLDSATTAISGPKIFGESNTFPFMRTRITAKAWYVRVERYWCVVCGSEVHSVREPSSKSKRYRTFASRVSGCRNTSSNRTS
jgi:hypothetical protein